MPMMHLDVSPSTPISFPNLSNRKTVHQHHQQCCLKQCQNQLFPRFTRCISLSETSGVINFAWRMTLTGKSAEETGHNTFCSSKRSLVSAIALWLARPDFDSCFADSALQSLPNAFPLVHYCPDPIKPLKVNVACLPRLDIFIQFYFLIYVLFCVLCPSKGLTLKPGKH